MTKKLIETFNLPETEEELLKELEEKFKFSSNPDLNEIAKIALTAYKDQMLDVMHFDPKYRSRALEVANQFLTIAKDAISKQEEIEIKKELNELKREQVKGKENPNTDNDVVIDRDAVLLEFKKRERKTNES